MIWTVLPFTATERTCNMLPSNNTRPNVASENAIAKKTSSVVGSLTQQKEMTMKIYRFHAECQADVDRLIELLPPGELISLRSARALRYPESPLVHVCIETRS